MQMEDIICTNARSSGFNRESCCHCWIGGELEDSANLTFDGSTLTVSGDLDPTNVSIASTLQVTGIATFLSGIRVAGIATVGVLTVTGGAVVGGDLIVDGDYVVDEISARNLTLTGIATIGSGVTMFPHGGVAIAGITTIGGALNANGTSNFADDQIGVTGDKQTYHLINQPMI